MASTLSVRLGEQVSRSVTRVARYHRQNSLSCSLGTIAHLHRLRLLLLHLLSIIADSFSDQPIPTDPPTFFPPVFLFLLRLSRQCQFPASSVGTRRRFGWQHSGEFNLSFHFIDWFNFYCGRRVQPFQDSTAERFGVVRSFFRSPSFFAWRRLVGKGNRQRDSPRQNGQGFGVVGNLHDRDIFMLTYA